MTGQDRHAGCSTVRAAAAAATSARATAAASTATAKATAAKVAALATTAAASATTAAAPAESLTFLSASVEDSHVFQVDAEAAPHGHGVASVGLQTAADGTVGVSPEVGDGADTKVLSTHCCHY